MNDLQGTEAMEHPRIDEERILDRYLAGRLDPQEEALFEEHLFECGECLEGAQAGEQLRRGLQQVAAEDAVPMPVAPGALAWLRGRSPTHLASLLVLALWIVGMPVLVLRQQAELGRLEGENARLISEGAETPSAGGRALVEPLANLAVVSLGVSRDAGDAVEIRPNPESDALLLSLELPVVEAAEYRVFIHDTAGETLWSSGELVPTLYDTLLVALPPSFLPPGEYRIEVRRAPAGSSESAGGMTFRVLAPTSDPSAGIPARDE
jgi:hypothetical protein